MKEVQHYVLFPNHDNGMRLYKKLKEEGVGAVIAPTPRSASKCCGISLLVREEDLDRVRRCVEDYEMIAPGDRIAVGVSGGKDSLLTLAALAKLREFYPVPYEVEAITLDMGHADGLPGMDFAPIAAYCRELNVPYTVIPSEIQR